MVTMVTVFVGVEIFYAAAMWRRDVHKLAWVHRITERSGVGFLALAGLIAGIVFGVLTALDGGFDLAACWLITAYVPIGIFLVNAGIIGRDVFHTGGEAVKAVEGERPTEESNGRSSPTVASSSYSPTSCSSG